MYALWGDLANCETTMDFWAEGAVEPSSWSYRFDENGDLRWAVLRDKTGFVNTSVAFEYDALGDLSATTMNPRPGGRYGSRTVVRWTPNRDSQLLVDSDGDGRPNARTHITRVDGQPVSQAADEDGDGRPDSWISTWTSGAFDTPVLQERIYAEGESTERSTFDSLGRLTVSETWDPDEVMPSGTTWRGYDAKGRAAWKENDNDGDGVAETYALWDWRCP